MYTCKVYTGLKMNNIIQKIHVLFLILFVGSFIGCASNTPDTAGKSENDPFESINREIFAFNDTVDEYFIGPIARGYRDILPDPVRTSIRNFLLNLNTPLSVINSTLQGDFERGLSGIARFTINSTVGLLGLIDVAAYLGLDPISEDTGQTFGVWGIGPGPYLVIPILGPSSTRDIFGKVGDYLIDPVGLYLIREDKEHFLIGTKFLQAIDTRVQLDAVIEGSRKNALDPYAIIRTMYLQRRAKQIANEDSKLLFFDNNIMEETSIFDTEINDED